MAKNEEPELVPIETLVLEETPTEVLVESTSTPTPTPAPAPTVTTYPRPRIRLGAVVWGIVVAATAAAVLWLGGSTDRRTDVATWLGALTPLSLSLIAVLAIGVFILVVALLALVRRGQKGPPIG